MFQLYFSSALITTLCLYFLHFENAKLRLSIRREMQGKAGVFALASETSERWCGPADKWPHEMSWLSICSLIVNGWLNLMRFKVLQRWYWRTHCCSFMKIVCAACHRVQFMVYAGMIISLGLCIYSAAPFTIHINDMGSCWNFLFESRSCCRVVELVSGVIGFIIFIVRSWLMWTSTFVIGHSCSGDADVAAY
jgi:hypothetical protein